ncbi:MAG TPA: hypothetical protein VFL91_09390 [Thermomicrobiales bacterium]|nr:hypothetical protein [Thermomicrobiales bacterium]
MRLIETCARRLTSDLRLAILWIKDEWRRRPTCGRTVLSVDIYDAVLERGIRTPAQFAAYLRTRGKPDE